MLKKLAFLYYNYKLALVAMLSPRKAAEIAFKMFCTPYSKRRRITPPLVFEDAEKLTFNFAEHNIHGFSWKASQPNGSKVLICHGFDSYSYRFYEFIEPLLDEGFDVLAFDAPGHGLSSGNQITMPVYRQMVLEIHQRFGPLNGIMAHSLGGLGAGLALERMKDHAHKRLVLISPMTNSSRAMHTFFQYIKVSDRVKDEFEKLIIEIGGGYPSSWYSVSRVMQQITTPTLWIHDKDDTITPYDDMKHMLEKNLSHLQFEITSGLGHSLYRDKDVAEKIVTFLAGLKDEKITTSAATI